MRRSRKSWLHTLTAVVVSAVIVMPLAIAGAQGQGQRASGAKATQKQIKALKQKTAALLREASALQAKMNAIEARVVPASLPPSGAAGGDLTGSYPNPQIRTGSIGSSQIADNSVLSVDIRDGNIASQDIADGSIRSSDIADGQVTGPDLAAGSVGSEALAGTFIEQRDLTIGADQSAGELVRCPGNNQLIGGGAEWGNFPPGSGQLITASYPDAVQAQAWTAFARNNTSSPKSFTVTAICLGP